VEGIDYRGVLYPGLILTREGPKVLEFNARLGDPETQVYLTRLETDLVEIIEASLDGQLGRIEPKWSPMVSVCVVMASGGYPGPYEKGKAITGLAEVAKLSRTKVFHAGTCRQGGSIVTSGGRVLGVTAWAETLVDARTAAYEGVGRIGFDGAQFRRDIAGRPLT
jgi:phosphoribosylamine--glycine ligase